MFLNAFIVNLFMQIHEKTQNFADEHKIDLSLKIQTIL